MARDPSQLIAKTLQEHKSTCPLPLSCRFGYDGVIMKGAMMRTVTLAELTRHADEYFEAVEQGEKIRVQRNGKPVAMVSPYRKQILIRWKKAKPMDLGDGISLSAAILAERAESR